MRGMEIQERKEVLDQGLEMLVKGEWEKKLKEELRVWIAPTILVQQAPGRSP